MLTFKFLEETVDNEGGLQVTCGDINCGIFLEGSVDGCSTVILRYLKKHNIDCSLEEIKQEFLRFLKEDKCQN